MKLVSFEATRAITQFDSRGATIAGLAHCSGQVQVAFLELDPGGSSGCIRGGKGEPLPIARGEARSGRPGSYTRRRPTPPQRTVDNVSGNYI